MKAIVIENEFIIPSQLQWFLQKNDSLFEEVDIQIACKHRPMDDIGRFIAKAEAVIFQTTWHYQQQFENFVQAFIGKKFGDKTYSFYIYEPIEALNEMLNLADGVKEAGNFAEDLLNLVSTNFVYGFDDKGNYKQVKIVNRRVQY